METQSTLGQTMGGSSPPKEAGGLAPMGSALPKSSPEQRAKWREKSKLAWLRRKAREQGLPEPVSSAPSPAPAPSSAAVPAPVVPWDASTLKPLWSSCVPAVEKATVAKLASIASPLGPVIVKKVEADAQWNTVAKTTLIETGPAVTAQALNALGIGAENSELVAFLGACTAIATSNALLLRELKAMVAEESARKESAPMKEAA